MEERTMMGDVIADQLSFVRQDKCQTRSVVYTGMMESDNPNPVITSSVVHGYFGST